MFLLLCYYGITDSDIFNRVACLCIVVEELQNSEWEKSCQATRIQTLEGTCFAHLNTKLKGLLSANLGE